MFDWFKKQAPARKLPWPQDDYDRNILGDIGRVGWSVLQINPDKPGDPGPPYSFSAGLSASAMCLAAEVRSVSVGRRLPAGRGGVSALSGNA
jgi:hypothetical protein